MTTTSSSASSAVIEKNYDAFSILEFLPRKSGQCKADDPSFLPRTVQRLHDGEVFQIGDEVANGMEYQGKQCRGKITGFDYLEDKVFVSHTWSGIGWNLASLSKVTVPVDPMLPSEFQLDEDVWVCMWSAAVGATIKAVHFYRGDIKYDIEVNTGVQRSGPVRLYNVASVLLSKTHPDHKSE